LVLLSPTKIVCEWEPPTRQSSPCSEIAKIEVRFPQEPAILGR